MLDVSYPIHSWRPSLHRDALEHGQHSEADVVKVRDAIVGTLPLLDARTLVVIAQVHSGWQFDVHRVVVVVARRRQVAFLNNFN